MEVSTTSDRRARQKLHARRWYERNREKAIARAKARVEADPEQRRAYSKAYREANRERLAAASRDRREADPEGTRERKRQDYVDHRQQRVAAIARWRRENPEKAKRLAQRHVDRRRARLVNAYVEDVDRTVVFARDKGLCGICGEAVDPADWHLDHVVALANGGEHSYANVQVSHPKCNCTKAHRG